jgi:hypothetical protein
MKWRLDPGQIEVVDDAVAEILRHKTPAQRVRMMSEAHRTARLIVEGGLRTRHPDWNDQRIKSKVARRMTRGASSASRMFGGQY